MRAEPLIAHRGSSLLRPENSLAAVSLTRSLGVGWIEVDANLLGDGTVVVFHDDVLDRLTGTTGHLKDQTWDTVADLDIGSHFSPAYRHERMPRLETLLEHTAALGLGLNLELKLYPHFSPARMVYNALPVIERHWSDTDRLIISSFSEEVLGILAEERPDWQLGYLCRSVPRRWSQIADQLNLVSIHCHYQGVDERTVRRIKDRGLDVYCYTVNDRPTGEALWKHGVDGLITDDPLLFSGR